jgi:uncharacterized damage-inducible protein DinB
MVPSEALTLFDYDRWATAKQIEVVTTLSNEQYERDLRSSHGGVRGTLVHIYGAQQIWYSRWKGASPTSLPAVTEVPTVGILQDKWQALRTEIHEFITALTEEKLREPLAYKDTQGVPYKQPLAQLIRHVINHSTYHRGQVTTMLRQLGVAPPPSIDLITYYREVDAVLEFTRRSVEKR